MTTFSRAANARERLTSWVATQPFPGGSKPLTGVRGSWSVCHTLVFALLLAFVVAHGCHGPDEDHEPSTRAEISSE